MIRQKISIALFAAVLSFSLLCQNAWAIQVLNSSDRSIAGAVLKVNKDRKIPQFVKVLPPGEAFDFSPDVEGPFLVSVADLDTKQTLRLERVKDRERVIYTGDRLIKKR